MRRKRAVVASWLGLGARAQSASSAQPVLPGGRALAERPARGCAPGKCSSEPQTAPLSGEAGAGGERFRPCRQDSRVLVLVGLALKRSRRVWTDMSVFVECRNKTDLLEVKKMQSV